MATAAHAGERKGPSPVLPEVPHSALHNESLCVPALQDLILGQGLHGHGAPNDHHVIRQNQELILNQKLILKSAA